MEWDIRFIKPHAYDLDKDYHLLRHDIHVIPNVCRARMVTSTMGCILSCLITLTRKGARAGGRGYVHYDQVQAITHYLDGF